MSEPEDSNPEASVAINNADGNINVTSIHNNIIINVDKPKHGVSKPAEGPKPHKGDKPADGPQPPRLS
jgi:hypothetical protein